MFDCADMSGSLKPEQVGPGRLGLRERGRGDALRAPDHRHELGAGRGGDPGVGGAPGVVPGRAGVGERLVDAVEASRPPTPFFARRRPAPWSAWRRDGRPCRLAGGCGAPGDRRRGRDGAGPAAEVLTDGAAPGRGGRLRRSARVPDDDGAGGDDGGRRPRTRSPAGRAGRVRAVQAPGDQPAQPRRWPSSQEPPVVARVAGRGHGAPAGRRSARPGPAAAAGRPAAGRPGEAGGRPGAPAAVADVPGDPLAPQRGRRRRPSRWVRW